MRTAEQICIPMIIWSLSKKKTDVTIHGELAGPTLFRGRFRAFGKCTNGVTLSKGGTAGGAAVKKNCRFL